MDVSKYLGGTRGRLSLRWNTFVSLLLFFFLVFFVPLGLFCLGFISLVFRMKIFPASLFYIFWSLSFMLPLRLSLTQKRKFTRTFRSTTSMGWTCRKCGRPRGMKGARRGSLRYVSWPIPIKSWWSRTEQSRPSPPTWEAELTQIVFFFRLFLLFHFSWLFAFYMNEMVWKIWDHLESENVCFFGIVWNDEEDETR